MGTTQTTTQTATIEIHRFKRWVGYDYRWNWVAAVRYAGEFPVAVGDYDTKAEARKAAEAFIASASADT